MIMLRFERNVLFSKRTFINILCTYVCIWYDCVVISKVFSNFLFKTPHDEPWYMVPPSDYVGVHQPQRRQVFYTEYNHNFDLLECI